MASAHGLTSSRQAISQHLDVLETAGLVRRRREGRYTFHDLDTTPLAPAARAVAPPRREDLTMRITLTSVLVDDQAKALDFYTRVLGFAKKTDIPLGEHRVAHGRQPRRRRTASSSLLEPDEHPAARTFKAALVADGIPFTAFSVDDVEAEHARLSVGRRRVHPAAGADGARSSPPCSTTPAATSSRSSPPPRRDGCHHGPPCATKRPLSTVGRQGPGDRADPHVQGGPRAPRAPGGRLRRRRPHPLRQGGREGHVRPDPRRRPRHQVHPRAAAAPPRAAEGPGRGGRRRRDHPDR